MTAELWLEKPCEHGKTSEHLRATCLDLHPGDRPRSHFKQCWCPGGSRVRLDPQKVVFSLWAVEAIADAQDDIRVWDIIEALGEEQK